MKGPAKKVQVIFYEMGSGNVPVRDWIRGLGEEAKRAIGFDLQTLEFGWPIGMPTCRSLGGGLWEVRTNLKNQIARIIFMVDGSEMILLHGFIKKTQKTPNSDLRLAKRRKGEWEKAK